MKEFCDLFIKPALVGLLAALVLIGGCDFYRKVLAAEPAQQAPAQRTIEQLSVEELWTLIGRIEAERDIVMNQVNERANAQTKTVMDQITKLKGGVPPTKGAKQ